MNPLREWGVIKIQPKEKPPTMKPLTKEGNQYTLAHLTPKEENITTLQTIYNTLVIPNLLNLEIIRKTITIEPPQTHPIKEFNKLLPTTHAILLNITPTQYTKLLNLPKQDLPIIKLMYKYLKTTPYYHTPHQANHTGDYNQPLPNRIFTLMKNFNPRTLRFLIIKQNKKTTLTPILLPKYELVKKTIPPETYYTYHTLPPLITLEHLKNITKTILEKPKTQPNTIASKYLALSLWGADIIFQFTKNMNTAIIQINTPQTTQFKTTPIKTIALIKNHIPQATQTHYKNTILLHYDPNTKTLYFQQNQTTYKTQTNNKPTITKNKIILQTKNNHTTLDLEEHYYNELMTKILKTQA